MKPILMLTLLLVSASLTAQANTPPTISITMNGAPVPAWSIQYVASGATVASLNLQITVDDADGDSTSLDAIVANGGGTDASAQLGINYLEWAHSSAPVAYTLTPTTGGFGSAGGVGTSGSSEIFNIWFQAYDGSTQVVTGFKIWVDPPTQPPTITVAQSGTPIANATQISVADGTTLAALGLTITTDDPAGLDVALATSIDDTGTTGMQVSEFSASSAATPYSIQPTSGTFHQPGFVHNINIWAQNPTGVKFLFTFSVLVTAANPVLEVTAGGSPMQSGQAAAGTPRDFGTLVTGGTATLSVVIQNTGNADLHLGMPVISAGSGAFTIVISGFTPTVAPGSSTSFAVEFSPATVGDWNATISFTHDAPAGSTFHMEVHGAAMLAGAPSSMSGGGAGSGGGCAANNNAGFAFAAVIGLLLISTRRRRRA